MNQGKSGFSHKILAGIGAALGLLWLSPTIHAQLAQDAPVSTEGTQFVLKPQSPPAPASRPAARLSLPPLQPASLAGPPSGKAPLPEPGGLPSRLPSVVFLLDTSDSMLDKSPGKDISHLDEARNAIAEVIRRMPPDAHVQVWHFNSRMYSVQVGNVRPGTFVPVGDVRQRDELIAKLRDIRTAGPTNLYESIVRALDFFSAPVDQPLYRSGQRFPVLVVVSDGEDTGSPVKIEDVQAAKRSHPLVTVNAIGFTVAKDDPWYKLLCQLATSPTGCATADDQGQLHSILESFYRPAPGVR